MSSTVIAKNVQIGADGTASNNFTIFQPATPDGTLRIGNGNTGITSSAVALTSSGSVSIGASAAAAGTTLRLSKSLTGGTAAYGVLMNGAIQSDVTSQSNSFTSQPSTAATAFTLTSLRHYLATQSTIGAGSTVTNQYGFAAASSLTGATNNYGFYSDIASGTGRYNFYANGTADNYFAGNVGIGTSSPTSASGYGALSLNGSTGGLLSLKVGGTDTGYVLANASEFAFKGTTNAPATFYTNNTERGRFDTSGNFLVGTTNATGNGVTLTGNGNGRLYVGRTNADAVAEFYYSGTRVGQINITSSSTSYITSSDYRLKENIAPMTGALAKVAALKPVTYTWKLDGSDGQGFIAHELQEVCPDAVVGEKDAVNEDGSIKAQGIDTSFLVATLTAAIQEQQAIITALTARVTALENQP